MNVVNVLMDQQFTADINIFPGYDLSSSGKLLKVMSEEEVAELIKAGEQATWPTVPTIGTTTQIGRPLDGILHAFQIDEAHWLRTAAQPNTALDAKIRHGGNGLGPAKAKRSKPVSKIIEDKSQKRVAPGMIIKNYSPL